MQVRLGNGLEKGQGSVGDHRSAPVTIITPVPHSHSFTHRRHYIYLVTD
jgi:hypothetical protein